MIRQNWVNDRALIACVSNSGTFRSRFIRFSTCNRAESFLMSFKKNWTQLLSRKKRSSPKHRRLRSEVLENRQLLAANISAGVQFSTDGATFSDDLSASAGEDVWVRINYDNVGDLAANNAQASVTLPAGVQFVPGSTRTVLAPVPSEMVANTDAGQSGAIDESAVWTGDTLTISPQAGLYGQAIDATAGVLEIGKKAFINLHDCHYFNGIERFFVTADSGISGTNVSNTMDAAAACAGVVGGHGNAGQELRSDSLLGQRYLNYHEGHYNFLTDHIYKNADGTATRTSNTVDAAFNLAGTAGAHILHPDSHFENLDLLGNRYINLHEGRYQSGGDTISVNLAAGGTNTSNAPDAAASLPATMGAYSLIDSAALALDTLDSTRGAGFIEFKVDTTGGSGALDFVAMISDVSGNSEFANQSDTGTLTLGTLSSDSFVVDTIIDENNGVGVGEGTSLREAIIAANASPNLSTITFDLSGVNVVRTALTGNDEDQSATGDLDIFTDIIIDAEGQHISIVTSSGDRLFDIRDGATVSFVDVDLSGINGTEDGFIARVHNSNVSFVNGSIVGFSDSDGAVVHNTIDDGGDWHVLFKDAEVDGLGVNGGVIHNTASNGSANVEVVNSEIRLARATGDGGAIFNHATGGLANLSVINSTFYNARADQVAGVVYNTGTAALVNTTIGSSDSIDSGAIFNSGEMTLTNVTIADSGGIENEGNLTVNNTIAARLGANETLFGSGTSTGGNNLSDDGQLPGSIGAVTNLAQVAALNGGSTRNYYLGAGSNAIDAGSNAAVAADSFDLDNDGDSSEGLPLDQRGYNRIENGTVDIGAVEVTVADQFVVTTAVDENDGLADPAVGSGTSLREAISAANQNPNRTTITFAPSLDGTPILLTLFRDFANDDFNREDNNRDGDLDINGEILILGNGSSNTIIDGGGTDGLDDRIFHVMSKDLSFPTSAEFRGLTIQGGAVSSFNPFQPIEGAGGAILNETAHVEVRRSTLTATRPIPAARSGPLDSCSSSTRL